MPQSRIFPRFYEIENVIYNKFTTFEKSQYDDSFNFLYQLETSEDFFATSLTYNFLSTQRILVRPCWVE